MADEKKPGDNQPQDDGNLHYYSGGEVKELAGTRVSPVLWGFYILLIAGAVIALFLLGSLGPNVTHVIGSPAITPYQPRNASFQNLTALQGQLNAQSIAAGLQTRKQ